MILGKRFVLRKLPKRRVEIMHMNTNSVARIANPCRLPYNRVLNNQCIYGGTTHEEGLLARKIQTENMVITEKSRHFSNQSLRAILSVVTCAIYQHHVKYTIY